MREAIFEKSILYHNPNASHRHASRKPDLTPNPFMEMNMNSVWDYFRILALHTIHSIYGIKAEDFDERFVA
jgi:hypothetical protein